MDLTPANKRNPPPAPIMTPRKFKPLAHCNHCKFSVPWDDLGQALLEDHFIKHHPDRI